MSVLVSLRIWQYFFLIRWFLVEKLAIFRRMDSELTSEFRYPAKFFVNPVVP